MGGGKVTLRLRINVSIEPGDYSSGNGQLQINEQFEVPNLGFLEMCRILGEFDALAQKFKPPVVKK